MKGKKGKGYAAPIVITALLLLYMAVYFGFLFSLLSPALRLLLALVPLGMAAVLICVCVERIKEIGSDEKDDLSQY